MTAAARAVAFPVGHTKLRKSAVRVSSVSRSAASRTSCSNNRCTPDARAASKFVAWVADIQERCSACCAVTAVVSEPELWAFNSQRENRYQKEKSR